MTHEEEVKTISEIFDFELKRDSTEKELAAVQKNKFKSKPDAPVRQEAPPPKYPDITPTRSNKLVIFLPLILSCIYTFTDIDHVVLGVMLLCPASVIWALAYYFIIYNNRRREEVKNIQNSPQYRNRCAEIDKERAERQAKLDEVYKQQMEEYKEKILPEYIKQLVHWETEHGREVQTLTAELQNITDQLKKLYDNSGIVPQRYRKISALEFIKETITTSNYDVKTAIEMYDRNEQRKLDEARLREQRIANQYAAEQNALAEEQNYIADRARRDANRAAAASAFGNGIGHHQDGKKDLFGTSVCQRCNSPNDSMKHYSCMTCPAQKRCTQKYR